MNYVSAVLGIFVILLSGIWLAYRKVYQGPAFGVILGGEVLRRGSLEEVVIPEHGKGEMEKPVVY